jgi:hypothetical protein
VPKDARHLIFDKRPTIGSPGESWDQFIVRKLKEERHYNEANGLTYVSSSILEELTTRIKALEYRVSEHDAEINALDWEIRGENYDEPEQMEFKF